MLARLSPPLPPAPPPPLCSEAPDSDEGEEGNAGAAFDMDLQAADHLLAKYRQVARSLIPPVPHSLVLFENRKT